MTKCDNARTQCVQAKYASARTEILQSCWLQEDSSVLADRENRTLVIGQASAFSKTPNYDYVDPTPTQSFHQFAILHKTTRGIGRWNNNQVRAEFLHVSYQVRQVKDGICRKELTFPSATNVSATKDSSRNFVITPQPDNLLPDICLRRKATMREIVGERKRKMAASCKLYNRNMSEILNGANCTAMPVHPPKERHVCQFWYLTRSSKNGSISAQGYVVQRRLYAGSPFMRPYEAIQC